MNPETLPRRVKPLGPGSVQRRDSERKLGSVPIPEWVRVQEPGYAQELVPVSEPACASLQEPVSERIPGRGRSQRRSEMTY